MLTYQIISTGSKGNAVIIDGHILIDCGVPFRELAPALKDIDIILLTHIHGDHFKPSTVRRIAIERPLLRWGCCRWMVKPLVDAGVSPTMIDIFLPGGKWQYDSFSVAPVELIHDVPNCGYKLELSCGNVFYATDTGNLNGVEAKNFDLYLIEVNYTEADMQRRIAKKQAAGEFCYETRAAKNHLSEEQAIDWLYKNMGQRSKYVYLHCHDEQQFVATA